PAVVLALSIASVTYGALLGSYLLAGTAPRVRGPDVVRGAIATVSVMLVTIFASRLAGAGLTFLEPLGRLAWPWYVPMGTAITMLVATPSSRRSSARTGLSAAWTSVAQPAGWHCSSVVTRRQGRKVGASPCGWVGDHPSQHPWRRWRARSWFAKAWHE